MDKKEVIEKVLNYLEQNFKNEATGHDYWHFIRVWKTAQKIAKKEGGDLFVIELGALLHDIADWKFNGGTNEVGIKMASELLKNLSVDQETIKQVCYIIDNISFKGAKVKNNMATKEGRIVQDADKLDVIGAIGIARVFAYGGKMNREIYNPDIRPVLHTSFEEYKNNKGTSINHFYEKVLLLKDMMNTKTAKKIAKNRDEFTKNYLKEFFKEWDGKI